MRLFAAIWPPSDVVTILDGLARPELPAVRWTAPAQWHVTMAFYGEVVDPDLTGIVAALSGGVEGLERPVVAGLGGRPIMLGDALCLPVAGLEYLGDVVRRSSTGFGWPADPRPFRPHLTLARLRRGRSPRRSSSRDSSLLEAVGVPAVRWPVDELRMMRSTLGSGGSRYETVAAVRL